MFCDWSLPVVFESGSEVRKDDKVQVSEKSSEERSCSIPVHFAIASSTCYVFF